MTNAESNFDVPAIHDDAPPVMARVVGPTLWDRLWAVAVIAAIVIALVSVYCWNPAKEGDGFFPKCPTFVATGLHCPGCGTLRAMHQLLHGHLLAALHFNLMTVVMLPAMGYGLMISSVSKITGRRLPCPRISAKLAWTLLAVLILFTVLRNFPYYPLTLLAPPSV